MKDTELTLAEAFGQAEFIIGGHGSRKVKVLQEVLAHVDGEQYSDHYGNGEIIDQFQQQMADVLGKEAAVFFPSGTMAQQIALRIWCDRKGIKRVAYHPLSHLEIHEEDGLKELHQIESILLADEDRLIRMEDVEGIDEEISCLLLELPQREIGGQLPAYEELEAISSYCRERGIKLHLDGARLFEISPYYQKTAAEICSLFDSVYVSFYKGIGGIAGAILAGDTDVMQESKIWKRRHGGDLIGLYPYILSSQYYFNERIGKMGLYYEQAKELASLLNACHGIRTLPEVPVSNMFHVHILLAQAEVERILASMAQQFDIGITSYLQQTSDHSCAFELSTGDRYPNVPKDMLRSALEWLDGELRKHVKY
ncbi:MULTISPECIES: threonine aldolase family protein [unclassified Paenibacillus]|uniref:threonine aldolase family protein n=1 Tax=unclassified Paenibacillus TaxID=185978 RepID=UPI000410B495|nr:MULTISPECIES: beta-eliminating lyase-related protein [unclassified Paenibacillus]KGP84649.1 threonine aldolase [Paenibacillus sp. MAEPY2]KGP86817.1 threonine aldolase [Paenibacillus sp. MAEPY1]